MIIIKDITIWRNTDAIKHIYNLIVESLEKAYTEDAFAAQLQIWNEELQQHPKNKRLNLKFVYEEGNKTAAICDMKDTSMAKAYLMLSLTFIHDTAVTRSGCLLEFKDSATIALQSFSALFNIKMGNNNLDTDELKAEATELLAKVYNRCKQKEGTVNTDAIAIILGIMVSNHFKYLMANDLKSEAQQFYSALVLKDKL